MITHCTLSDVIAYFVDDVHPTCMRDRVDVIDAFQSDCDRAIETLTFSTLEAF